MNKNSLIAFICCGIMFSGCCCPEGGIKKFNNDEKVTCCIIGHSLPGSVEVKTNTKIGENHE
jgi:hypothetical protein